MKPVVKFVITDVHMGQSHHGLNQIIALQSKSNKLFAQSIKTPGSLILFLNKSRSAAKLFARDSIVLGYVRLQNGTLDQRAIDAIPRAFGGSLEYSSAVKNALKKFLVAEKEIAVNAQKAILQA